jgi:hypothetical protein
MPNLKDSSGLYILTNAADRPCGECTSCCRILRIRKRNDGGHDDFPFDKPAGVTCQHCREGRGCEIFTTADLPNLCKMYSCLWKDSRYLPAAWRPDKVNAVCSVEGYILGRLVIRVTVDSRVPVIEDFSRWVDWAVARGVAFAVQTEGGGSVISNSPELSKAIDDVLRTRDR